MKQLVQFVTLLLLAASTAFAQANPDAAKMEIGVGGTFAKPKIIPSLNALALAQLSINYKLTSTAKVVGKEKSTGAMAGAKLTAFLETTDGKLTDADFQEVSDHFYHYFQRQLKANGIDTVAWSKIAASEFYRETDAKLDQGAGGNSENNWVTNNANGGKVIYGGLTGFAFGKIKKATAFCEEVGAPAAFLHLTVDFADILLDVDIKSSTYNGYYTVTKSRTWKYNSAAQAIMGVVPVAYRVSLFWNEKSQSESLYLTGDIYSKEPYHDNISQDQGRMKNSLWAFSKEMTPVVIETTREKYKAAAKKALERYADAFIAKHLELKK